MRKIVSVLLTLCLGIVFSPKTFAVNKPNDDFKKEWQLIDSLENLGLTKTALEQVEIIYQKSLKNQDAPNLVKSFIFKMKLESVLTENSDENSISNLQALLLQSKYPVKPVLQSLLAETYWLYLKKNRYKFHNRSQTDKYQSKDISTWDLGMLQGEIIKNYRASLHSTDSLKNIPLNIFDNVIISKQPETRRLRPTLYDFLAHRALEYFIHGESYLNPTDAKFEIADLSFFYPAKDFVSLTLTDADSNHLGYYALKIFQELLKFHLQDKQADALIDADLLRLNFVKQNAVMAEKEQMHFNALMALSNEFKDQSSTAEVKYEVASYYAAKSNLYKAGKSDDFKWENKKALAICDEVIKAYPNTFGAQRCAYLKAKIQEKQLSFQVEQVNSSNMPFRALLSYKNLNKVYVRVIPWNRKVEERSYNERSESALLQYLKVKPQEAFEIVLPADSDYNAHAAEIKMPALKVGSYMLLIADNPEFKFQVNAVAFNEVNISNMSYLMQPQDKGGVNVLILDRNTGTALKNVNVILWQRRYDYEMRSHQFIKGSSFVSDENGQIKIPALNDYNNYSFELIAQDDYLFSDQGAYLSDGYRDDASMQQQTFLYTDRAIYRPGQTIYFKGILIETDGVKSNILPKKKQTLVLYDVNGEKLSELNLISNEYGTVSGSFVIPNNVLTGQMRLGADFGNRYFSVEEYKRPKFEVTLNPLEGEYQLDDTLNVTGFAKAFAGFFITGAKLKYRVLRNASFPYRYYDYYDSQQQEIQHGALVTNDKGEFEIRFKALPDRLISPNSEPVFNYTISVDVTDLSGETHSATGNVSVGYNSLLLRADMPDVIEKQSVKKYKIEATSLNGKALDAAIDVSVWECIQPERIFRSRYWQAPDKFILSQDEYYQSFKHDVYQQEDEISNWINGKLMLKKNINALKENNLGLDGVEKWESGVYVLVLKSKDKYGKQVEKKQYFTLFSKNDKQIPVYQTQWMHSPSVSLQPKDTAQVIIGTKDENVNMLYELEVGNKLVRSQWLKLSNESKVIQIPVLEEYRGDFSVHFTCVKNGRVFTQTKTFHVPFTNKELDFVFESFRDKLQPNQKETWRIKIKGKKGEKVMAELLTGMYDASLDAFSPNTFDLNIYNSFTPIVRWDDFTFYESSSSLLAFNWNTYPAYPQKVYERLNWFGFENLYYHGGSLGFADRPMAAAMSKMSQRAVSDDEVAHEAKAKRALPPAKMEETFAKLDSIDKKTEKSKESPVVSVRKNFNETAFFYPHLQTNDKGEVIISFQAPEVLTKWKLLGLAHTKDLSIGNFQKEVITQKSFMVQPLLPRFFREGDTITLATKLVNLTGGELQGKYRLELFDAMRSKSLDSLVFIDQAEQVFSLRANQSAVVTCKVAIPLGVSAITIRSSAISGQYSDGEEQALPVLSKRILITESQPLFVNGNQTKLFNFNKLIGSDSLKNMQHERLTLEFSANPAWYAIQALPYLQDNAYECSEQIFGRFYANSIAKYLANSNPKIKAVFDTWKMQADKETFLSNLEKNQELKSIVLSETPWVMDARSDSERKKRLALLFDLNQMTADLQDAKKSLLKMQLPNGGFCWFNGMEDDRYISQFIAAGIGHLRKLHIDLFQDESCRTMIVNLMQYLDARLVDDFNQIKNLGADSSKNQLSYTSVHYLYARSFFKDIEMDKTTKLAFDYFMNQSKKYWLGQGIYGQALIALASQRFGNTPLSHAILKSLKENSIVNEELGMYWKSNVVGYGWYEAPVETQSLLIECFDEVVQDSTSVDLMRVWLLKQKQTQDWKSSKATADACYALLLRGSNLIANSSDVQIKLGSKTIDTKQDKDIKQEAGTGYFKMSWPGSDIKPDMGQVSVKKSEQGIAWGALYWQYFQNIENVTSHKTNLALTKQLFVERPGKGGPVILPIDSTTALVKGDKILVRITLKSDRDMDYVHLKDMRASSLEPVSVISQSKYQDGISYYESTKDAASHFFINHLYKGSYVFEYALRVSFSGAFSNGVASIQCMYAPEFSSFSESVKLNIE